MTEQVALWAVKQSHCSENGRWPAVIYSSAIVPSGAELPCLTPSTYTPQCINYCVINNQARRQGGFHVAWKPPPPPPPCTICIVNVNNLLKLELDLFAIELIAITILLQRIFGTARYAHAQNTPLRAICGRGLSKFRRAQPRDLYTSPLFKILPTPLIMLSKTILNNA